MRPDENPVVTRIGTESGSHVEPPLDQSASELEKLRWHAAVVFVDSGVRVGIHPQVLQHKRRGKWVDNDHVTYAISVGNSSTSPFTYDSAWTYLNGISCGAVEAVRTRDTRIAELEAEVTDWKQGSDVEAHEADRLREELGQALTHLRALIPNQFNSSSPVGVANAWLRDRAARVLLTDQTTTPASGTDKKGNP